MCFLKIFAFSGCDREAQSPVYSPAFLTTSPENNGGGRSAASSPASSYHRVTVSGQNLNYISAADQRPGILRMARQQSPENDQLGITFQHAGGQSTEYSEESLAYRPSMSQVSGKVFQCCDQNDFLLIRIRPKTSVLDPNADPDPAIYPGFYNFQNILTHVGTKTFSKS